MINYYWFDIIGLDYRSHSHYQVYTAQINQQ